ncbi:MAG: GNAT family N-acetyltransferase, partial [Campylobacterales bacterium]|nr:GNAT family N-acetyltransferase [Campylobacterales bacterium]
AFWIDERDNEGTTLLALDKKSFEPIGFLHFFKTGKPTEHKKLRLGYVIKKESWGSGFATEILRGFIERLKHESIKTLYAGVNQENFASQNVLKKCGFVSHTRDANEEDLLFELDLYGKVNTQDSKRESLYLHSY